MEGVFVADPQEKQLNTSDGGIKFPSKRCRCKTLIGYAVVHRRADAA